MYYGYHPFSRWFSPWGPPMGIGYPMMGGWGSPPHAGMWQMPYFPPPGGYGAPWMSPFGPPITPEQEIAFLREQAEMLKGQMDQIEARIKELDKEVQ
jgi:hypothetical protein